MVSSVQLVIEGTFITNKVSEMLHGIMSEWHNSFGSNACLFVDMSLVLLSDA